MKWIKFIVFSNLWISFSVAAYILSTYLLFDIPVDWLIVSLSFVATLMTYNYQRIVRFQFTKTKNPIINWMEAHSSSLMYVVVAGFILLAMIARFLEIRTIVVCGVLALISWMYSYPFISKKSGLRDIRYIKIFIIALVWTGTAALPFVELGLFPEDRTFYLFLTEKALFILAITIPFDIRDLGYDEPSKKTIPQIIGVRGAILIAVILLLCHLVISNCIYTSSIMMAYGINAFLTLLLLIGSSRERKELYFTGLIDALPVTQMILLLLADQLNT